MNNIIIDKSYYAELACPLAASPIQTNFFPLMEILRGKLIQGIQFYTVAATPLSQAKAVLASNALLKSCFVTLDTGGEKDIWNLPLVDLIQPQTTGLGFNNPTIVEFNNINVDWTKSYIFVTDTLTFAATPEVWAFNIKYTDKI